MGEEGPAQSFDSSGQSGISPSVGQLVGQFEASIIQLMDSMGIIRDRKIIAALKKLLEACERSNSEAGSQVQNTIQRS